MRGDSITPPRGQTLLIRKHIRFVTAGSFHQVAPLRFLVLHDSEPVFTGTKRSSSSRFTVRYQVRFWMVLISSFTFGTQSTQTEVQILGSDGLSLYLRLWEGNPVLSLSRIRSRDHSIVRSSYQSGVQS